MPELNQRLRDVADACIRIMDQKPHPAFHPERWPAVVQYIVCFRAAFMLNPDSAIGGTNTQRHIRAIRLALARHGFTGPKPLADVIQARRNELSK